MARAGWVASPNLRYTWTCANVLLESGQRTAGEQSMSQSSPITDMGCLAHLDGLSGCPEVEKYLDENPFLVPLLAEAGRILPRHFPDATLRLEVVIDPEVPNEKQLVLSIAPRLPAPEALAVLRRFDEGWWLDRLPEAQDRLAITLTFE
jgi:hypothetical protein